MAKKNGARRSQALSGDPKRVLDRAYKELRPGQIVMVRWPYYYLNVREDQGIVDRLDEYGGVYIRTDHPVPHYDRRGFVSHHEPWIYFSAAYDYENHVYVASGKLGDPFEHGEAEVFIEIMGDSGIALGARGQLVECRFKCPGGLVADELRTWVKPGETGYEACKRYIMKKYAMDEYQWSLCEKIQVRYID